MRTGFTSPFRLFASIRHLHSFPTRRSSDLKSFTALGIAQLVDRQQADLDAPVTKYVPDFQLSDPQVVQALKIGDVFRDGRVDRKSTRLNSSHSSISYAVFCLKKKNYAYYST